MAVLEDNDRLYIEVSRQTIRRLLFLLRINAIELDDLNEKMSLIEKLHETHLEKRSANLDRMRCRLMAIGLLEGSVNNEPK